MAGDVDLNGGTTPNNVPSVTTIVATFSSDVDQATANSQTITLTRDYDDAVIDLTITVAGKTITIDPGDMGNGALYELKFLAGIKGTNGLDLAAFTRTFTTVGNFVPSGVFAYWNFDDNTDDQIGTFDPAASDVVDVTYSDSRNAAALKAATFNGTSTLIEVPNGDQLMSTHDFTLSFWVKTNSADKTSGHFVMGLAGWFGFQFEIFGDYNGCKLAAQYDLGDGSSASEDLWFPADGNLGWQGWTYCRDLTAAGGLPFLIQDKWAHVVCVYNSANREGHMYINGDIMKSQDFDLWPDGDAKRGVVGMKYGGVAPEVVNELAFGFIQSRAGTLWDTEPWGGYDIPTSNHFGGLLDDVRIYHRVLTEDEIFQMYNSAK
jgi:hypothetical protein